MRSIVLILFFISVVSSQTIGDLNFYFIGDNTTDFKNITSAPEFSLVYNTSYFNPNKKTILFFHGFTNKFTSSAPRAIANAYLTRGDHNIILADWYKICKGNYMTVVKNISKVRIITLTLKLLIAFLRPHILLLEFWMV